MTKLKVHLRSSCHSEFWQVIKTPYLSMPLKALSGKVTLSCLRALAGRLRKSNQPLRSVGYLTWPMPYHVHNWAFLTYYELMTPYGIIELGQPQWMKWITVLMAVKPLPQAMLTYHQLDNQTLPLSSPIYILIYGLRMSSCIRCCIFSWLIIPLIMDHFGTHVSKSFTWKWWQNLEICW